MAMKKADKKGVNTFKDYQEKKQKRREQLIIDYLAALKKSRATFKYVTDLAAHVAAHIAREEQGECNRATLLRNTRYKALLLSYMASTMSGGTKSIAGATLATPDAKALVIERDLIISNLRRELERLSRYCEQLEAKLDAKGPGTVSTVPQAVMVANVTAEADYKYRFVRTCQALQLVLDYLPGQFRIDPNEVLLRDSLKKRGNNIVVQAENFRPFVEWLEKAPA